MRKLLALVVLALTLTGAAPISTLTPRHDQPELLQNVEVTVFITRTGARYHRDGCQYLRRSRVPVTLSAAKAAGYTPCHVCIPPD
jgi:hypothetical protein